MDLLATEEGNKYARSYLSLGKCGCYLIWNISPKKKKRFNCKYSGILRTTRAENCLLPKPVYKWQHVAMLAKGETRRQMMAPNSAVLFAGSLLWMHKWQVSTPGNYRLFLCLLLPLPSSCSPQPALLSPSAGLLRSENVPQKRTAISTAAQNVGSRCKSWWAAS